MDFHPKSLVMDIHAPSRLICSPALESYRKKIATMAWHRNELNREPSNLEIFFLGLFLCKVKPTCTWNYFLKRCTFFLILIFYPTGIMDFALLCSILLLKLLQFTSGRGTLKMNAYTTIECHMRVFEFNVTASKYDTFEGKAVMCHTMTKVKSCWGRCDSNEVQKPFIIVAWKVPVFKTGV